MFQLDTIHRNILSKLTSNPPEQPYIILTDQLNKNFEHNTFFVQITLREKLADERFSFDIIYQSDSSNNKRQQELTGSYFNEEIVRLQKEFDQRFENIFQLKTKQNMDEKKINFARSTLSNLIGGISYFTGKLKRTKKRRMYLLNFIFRSIFSSKSKSKNSESILDNKFVYSCTITFVFSTWFSLG